MVYNLILVLSRMVGDGKSGRVLEDGGLLLWSLLLGVSMRADVLCCLAPCPCGHF